MLNMFREKSAPVDALRREFDTSYVRDVLAKFNLPIMSVRDSVRNDMAHVGHVTLRHDVDRYIENAFALSRIEHALGITASYYFLFPDGRSVSSNYFGSIHKGRLHISKKFLETAKIMQDMGHEIGIHNDLVSLWIGTGIEPKDALAEILAVMRSAGLCVDSLAGHGSKLCYEHKYLNREIFSGCAGWRDDDMLDIDGKRLRLRSLSGRDFDLDNVDVGYFSPSDIVMHDSGNKLVMTPFSHRRAHDLDKEREILLTNASLKQNIIAKTMMKYRHPPIVHCLIHGEHWTIQYAMGDLNVEPCINFMKKGFFEEKARTKKFVLKNFDNVLYADTLDDASVMNDLCNEEIRHFPIRKRASPSPAGRAGAEHVAAHPRAGMRAGRFSAARGRGPAGGRKTRSCRHGSQLGGHGGLRREISAHALGRGHRGILPGQALLSDAEEVSRIPKKRGLILDKTGLIGVSNFISAYAVLKKISSLLASGGCCVRLTPTSSYATWYADRSRWPWQWIDIARKVFDIAEDLSGSPGARAFVFGMKN